MYTFFELWLLPYKIDLCDALPGNNVKAFVGPSYTDAVIDVD